jgi:hypothetical protein
MPVRRLRQFRYRRNRTLIDVFTFVSAHRQDFALDVALEDGVRGLEDDESVRGKNEDGG